MGGAVSSPAGATASEEPPRRSGPRLSRSLKIVLVVALIVVVTVAAGQFVRFRVMIERPGPVQDTLSRMDGQDVIRVSGTRSYPTSGTLDFTTVSVLGGPGQTVGLWQYLSGKLDRDAEIQKLPEDDHTTKQQAQQQSVAQMTGSQEAAEVIAIRAAGGKVGETVSIGALLKDGPAQGRLRAGDRVLRIDQRPAGTLNQVHSAMSKVKPGATASVTVQRSGQQKVVRVPTREQDGRAILGVLMDPKYSFPYTVTVDAGDVGGPSAGLMFSLAIYDKLTPGALTGGERVSGTGEMEADGSIGAIGGIRLKMIGAHESGARWFLAPAANCDEVKGNVPDGMTAVKVSSFDQARTQVQRIAAGKTSNLPTC